MIVNGIGDHGVQMLSEMLKENTTLTSLCLDGKELICFKQKKIIVNETECSLEKETT